MAISDRTVGRISLFVLTTLFGYYTVWTLLTVHLLPSPPPPFLPLTRHPSLLPSQPFLPPSPLLSLFPDREWAVRIPVLILLVGLSAVGMTTGCVLIETAKRKRQAARPRSGNGDETTRKRN
ncbi:hypothetical protein JCM5296_005393 [Sporobolomyces johnsonii]